MIFSLARAISCWITFHCWLSQDNVCFCWATLLFFRSSLIKAFVISKTNIAMISADERGTWTQVNPRCVDLIHGSGHCRGPGALVAFLSDLKQCRSSLSLRRSELTARELFSNTLDIQWPDVSKENWRRVEKAQTIKPDFFSCFHLLHSWSIQDVLPVKEIYCEFHVQHEWLQDLKRANVAQLDCILMWEILIEPVLFF